MRLQYFFLIAFVCIIFFSCVKNYEPNFIKASVALNTVEIDNMNVKLNWAKCVSNDFVQYKLYLLLNDTANYSFENPSDAKLIFASKNINDTTFVDSNFHNIINKHFVFQLLLNGRTIISKIATHKNGYVFNDVLLNAKKIANSKLAIFESKNSNGESELHTIDILTNFEISKSILLNVKSYQPFQTDSNYFVAVQTLADKVEIYNVLTYQKIGTVDMPFARPITNVATNHKLIFLSANTADSSVCYSFDAKNFTLQDSIATRAGTKVFTVNFCDSVYCISFNFFSRYAIDANNKFDFIGDSQNLQVTVTNTKVLLFENGSGFTCAPNFPIIKGFVNTSFLGTVGNAQLLLNITNDESLIFFNTSQEISVLKKHALGANYFVANNLWLSPASNSKFLIVHDNVLYMYANNLFLDGKVTPQTNTIVFNQSLSQYY